MNSHTPGLFITLDGIDGVGKSTQMQQLREHLADRGHDIVCVRDPGGTDIGTRLRSILLDSQCEMHRRTEAMLFMASRCEMIETIVKPAINAGKTVLSDRFLLANVVYQSIGGSVSADQLWQMGRWANDGVEPDVTILLDMPAEASLRRLEGPADRMESRGVAYMESVRQAFLDQLTHSSKRTVVINADQPAEDVTAEIRIAVAKILEEVSPRPNGS